MAKSTDKEKKASGGTVGSDAARTQRLAGVVVRKSGDQTVAVEVSRVSRHPLYGKRRQTTKRYLAHDPENTATVGEQVTIREHRPISKRKRWIIETHKS